MATSSSSGSESLRAPETLTNGQTRAAVYLLYSGCIVTLLYCGSGLMHFLLGDAVYFRDILLGLHLCAGLVWLYRTRLFPAFVRRHWLLLVPALFLLPALGNPTYRVEALMFVKWGVFWLDWVFMGGLLLRVPAATTSGGMSILRAVAVLLLVIELGAGAYEFVTQQYILDVRGEVSAFGVNMGRQWTLGKRLRIKGLERDVFSFANLMAMSSILGLLTFIRSKDTSWRTVGLVWSAAFGLGMLLSGGRSAFFGVFASGVLAGALLLWEKPVRRNYGWIVFAWLVIGLAISFSGVGRLAETVGTTVMNNAAISNPGSAYDRDANWTGIINAIEGTPILLVCGAPLATIMDPHIDAMYHWADNQYLWLLYHTGVVGLLALVFYFAQIVRVRLPEEQAGVRDGLILFLLFVMGEAIARESLTFIGCLPLFVSAGLLCGLAEQPAIAQPSSHRSRRPGKEARIRSDASEFSRQIRRAQAGVRPAAVEAEDSSVE